MRTSDRGELDGLNWGLLSLGERVEAEDFCVMGAFFVEVADAAEAKFWVLGEEGLQFEVESRSCTDGGKDFGGHVEGVPRNVVMCNSRRNERTKRYKSVHICSPYFGSDADVKHPMISHPMTLKHFEAVRF